MMDIKIRHNLGALKDEINNLPNDITAAISAASMESANNIKDLLIQQYGNSMSNIIISFDYSGDKFTLKIDNINPYYFYNSTGLEISEVVDFLQKYLNENINKEIRGIPLINSNAN